MSGEISREYRPASPVVAIVMGLVITWGIAGYIVLVSGVDVVSLSVAGSIGGVMTAILIVVSALSNKARLILDRDGVTVISASGQRNIRWDDVAGIEAKRARTGRVHSTYYYLHTKAGKEVRLFMEGQFKEQKEIIQEIARRSGMAFEG